MLLWFIVCLINDIIYFIFTIHVYIYIYIVQNIWKKPHMVIYSLLCSIYVFFFLYNVQYSNIYIYMIQLHIIGILHGLEAQHVVYLKMHAFNALQYFIYLYMILYVYPALIIMYVNYFIDSRFEMFQFYIIVDICVFNILFIAQFP